MEYSASNRYNEREDKCTLQSGLELCGSTIFKILHVRNFLTAILPGSAVGSQMGMPIISTAVWFQAPLAKSCLRSPHWKSWLPPFEMWPLVRIGPLLFKYAYVQQ